VDGPRVEASGAVTRPCRAGKGCGRRWGTDSSVRARWKENSGLERVDEEQETRGCYRPSIVCGEQQNSHPLNQARRWLYHKENGARAMIELTDFAHREMTSTAEGEVLTADDESSDRVANNTTARSLLIAGEQGCENEAWVDSHNTEFRL